jgi:hypothetical protein
MHPSRWTARVGAIALLGSLGLVSSAQAATISPRVDIDPPEATNFSKTISIDKFDPSLGVLQTILLTFNGNVAGDFRVDNQGPSVASGTYNLEAEVKLSQSILGDLFALTPSNTGSFSVAVDGPDAFPDFVGADSQTLTGLAGTEQGTKTYSRATDSTILSAFTGTGKLDFLVDAKAQSTSTSPNSGNIAQFFTTNAGANFTITYTYDPPVRVPEASSNFGVGLLAAGVMATQLKRISRLV